MRSPTADREAGMVSTFAAIAVVVLMLGIGMVADAGRWISAEQYADNMAAEAGRAAAQQINSNVMITGDPELDTYKAAAAARSYLNEANVDGNVTVEGDLITITTTVERDPVLLSVAGLDAIRANGQATVRMATE